MSRNWTNEETVLFCQILTDPVCNNLETLEKKALKKSSTKEVFEAILEDFQTSLQNHEFIERNGKNFSGKKKKSEIVFDVKRLQQKYNNLKQNPAIKPCNLINSYTLVTIHINLSNKC